MKTAILCLIEKYDLQLDKSRTFSQLLERTKETLNPYQEGKMLESQNQTIEVLGGGKKKKRGSNSGKTIKPRRNKKRRTLRIFGGLLGPNGPYDNPRAVLAPTNWDVPIMVLIVYLVIASVVSTYKAIM